MTTPAWTLTLYHSSGVKLGSTTHASEALANAAGWGALDSFIGCSFSVECANG